MSDADCTPGREPRSVAASAAFCHTTYSVVNLVLQSQIHDTEPLYTPFTTYLR